MKSRRFMFYHTYMGGRPWVVMHLCTGVNIHKSSFITIYKSRMSGFIMPHMTVIYFKVKSILWPVGFMLYIIGSNKKKQVRTPS